MIVKLGTNIIDKGNKKLCNTRFLRSFKVGCYLKLTLLIVLE